MFYLGEIAALLICWLFYIEFYWMVERKVLKVCSRQYLRKRCSKPADRLFFTPVSGKAHLGTLYYLNRLLVYYLSIFTGGGADYSRFHYFIVTSPSALIDGVTYMREEVDGDADEQPVRDS